jgi:predicted methyltransferase
VNDPSPASATLQELAQSVRLREGPAGVERFLWILAREGSLTAREMAASLGIPIPVVSALRREMEKRGYLSRGSGIELGEGGLELVETLWPGLPAGSTRCPACGGTGLAPAPAVETLEQRIRTLCLRRPEADVRLDQAHLTPDCLIRKSSFLIQEGLTAGRRVLFLGDDDFLSLAVGMMQESLGFAQGGALHVLDVDPRILETIETVAREESLPVIASSGDARSPLPTDLRGSFDTVVTDPPYTVAGLDSFLSRASEALDGTSRAGRVALSFGRKSDMEQAAAQGVLTGHRLVIRGYYPGFNSYEGAAILAGISDLYLLSRAGKAENPGGEGAFYTSEARRGARTYRCTGCGRKMAVGPGEASETIRELKEAGCPGCGGKKFRYAGS